jgi:molecular chaperone DnaK (HSP70)
MKKREVIGIDFGTSYSSVAFLEVGSSDRPRLLKFKGQTEHVPTQLLVEKPDFTVKGWGWGISKKLEEYDSSENTIEVVREFKSRLGESDEDDRYCSLFLKKLRNRICEVRGGGELKKEEFLTCIGHPEAWSEKRRNKLKEITTECGFPDVRLLSEPKAGMHSLRVQPGPRAKFSALSETLLVVDFGGGTLDICLVKTKELLRDPEIISSGGNDKLGGKNFDKILERMFFGKNNTISRKDYEEHNLLHFREDVTEAKEAASREFAEGGESLIRNFQSPAGQRLSFEIKRDQFDGYCGETEYNYFGSIKSAVSEVFAKATEVSPNDLTKIVLTGGSSNFYFMRKLMHEALALDEDKEIFQSEEPFTDIATGLATSIGRSDDPAPRPGEWITCRINDEETSGKKEILKYDRMDGPNPDPIFLGTVLGTKNFFKQEIELTWYRGTSMDGSEETHKSLIEIYCRSHWRMFDKISRMWKSATEAVGAPNDAYQVNLHYTLDHVGDSKYDLVITDKDKEKIHNYQIVPGENLSQNLFFGEARPETRRGSSSDSN